MKTSHNIIEVKKPGRKVSSKLILTRDGQLRIPGGLLPEDARERDLYFVLVGVDPKKKTLELGASYGSGEDAGFTWRRKAVYTNEGAQSPLVPVKSLLDLLGIQLPADQRECVVRKHSDGVLEIKF